MSQEEVPCAISADAKVFAKEERKLQQRQQVRAEILQACAQVIVEKGVSGLSMEDVSQLAGLSKGSLYNYFSNREELIWVIIDTYRDQFLAACEPIFHNNQIDISARFTLLVELLFHTLEHQHGLVAVLDYFREQIHQARHLPSLQQDVPTARVLHYIEEFYGAFLPFLELTIAKNVIRGKDPRTVAFMLLDIISRLVDAKKVDILHRTSEDLRQCVLDLFTHIPPD